MQSREEKEIKKRALETLLDYSNTSGTECDNEDDISSTNHSTPIISRNMDSFFTDQHSFNSLNVSDSMFFDSETGKQLILNDQLLHESLCMEPDEDCAGCSSWTPCSRKNISSISIDFSRFKQKECVSVGEFMAVFSENTSFSDNQRKNPFSNFCASTTKEKRKSSSMSSLVNINCNEISKTSSLNFDLTKDEYSTFVTPTKPLKISTPNWNENNTPYDFKYYIGTTARKNIQRLRKEEKLLAVMDHSLSYNSLKAEKAFDVQSNNESTVTTTDKTTLILNYDSAITNFSTSGSYNLQWTIEPQLVILDPNKANRVRLINNSSKYFKFKTKFNSRMTDICPMSGTVPATDSIGLRVSISKYAKKQNKDFEDDIKVIVGKNEKMIHVKFVIEEISKNSKERSYILF